MNKFKNVVLAVISASMLIGGIGQLITLNGTFAVYNAYFQLTVGFMLFIWVAHKVINATEAHMKKPTNARDGKKS